ncbi:hypothetical protein HAX54_024192 [Datura stramonium]|uniref:Uncharacterized protein n=1 Tax=Datura stramonium TaxID=4076 RepID=A0ABS8UZA9_DATST|nr:hypothetical protein [Datura stramonium]
MGRKCTLCGRNGHNQRTCIEKGKSIKLFGVEVGTTAAAMSKKDYGRKIKKGSPWTEDEQRAFLKGLEFHGKGNWAKIGKDFLPSRTSTQIASHAQKYFMRLDATNSNEIKNRKKPSVFDLRLDKTKDTVGNQESAQETHHVPSFLPKIPTPKVLPLTWVYMYPCHHDASTSARTR